MELTKVIEQTCNNPENNTISKVREILINMIEILKSEDSFSLTKHEDYWRTRIWEFVSDLQEKYDNSFNIRNLP